MGDVIQLRPRRDDESHPPPGISFWCPFCERWADTQIMYAHIETGSIHCGCLHERPSA